MDVLLFQENNHGNITVENGVIEMSGGLDTAAYLSLFGGNEDDSGGDDKSFSWWGNFSEIDKAKKYISETQFLLKSLPAITANLRRLEDAVNRDLKWFLENKIASSIVATVSIPALNAIKINVNINADGVEYNFEFVENWKTIDETEGLPFTNTNLEWTAGDYIEWTTGDPIEWS